MDLRCPRCSHYGVVRTYDGVACLLCGCEIVEQKEPDNHIASLIQQARDQQRPRGRGRPRLYATNADKQRATYQRRKAKQHA